MYTIFTDHIRSGSLYFKHARGISDKSGKEFHIYHEIILFLDGDAEFISENLHMRLKPYTLIVIPRETFHQMVIHGDQESYYRCVIHFDENTELAPLFEEKPGGVLIFEADQEIQYLFNKLIFAAKGDSPHAPLILKSILSLLLDIIILRADRSNIEYHQNPLIQSVIAYINRNLAQPITLQEIAQACSISESSLSHIFKREMYISVHKFILNKRLMRAHHMISAGEAATTAAIECGFQDYSGFYKQYKKAFGFPPSGKESGATSDG